MDIHQNARLTLRSREAMVLYVLEEGFTRKAAAAAFRQACAEMQIQHRRTRPYTPRTNGKAERFIQTALREWAYRQHWASSEQRDAQLQPWTSFYNKERPHGSLAYSTPNSRLPNGTTS